MPPIRLRMGPSEWAILLLLSVLWGGAFFFIDVAVESVAPFTLVLLRVLLGAAILLLVLLVGGRGLPFERRMWGPFLVLALLNNAIPFSLFAWGQQHIASGLASILNATSPLWAVLVAHAFTDDEKATPLKILGVAVGFSRRSADDRRRPPARHRGRQPARPARLPGRDLQLRARRRPRSPLPPHGRLADRRLGRPAQRHGAGDAAAGAHLRGALACRGAGARSLGGDRRARPVLHRDRLHPLFPADRPGRRDQRHPCHLPDPGDRDPARRPVPRRGRWRCAISSAWA